jgi:alpha-tubulin suppressor-like RCC1 family protein
LVREIFFKVIYLFTKKLQGVFVKFISGNAFSERLESRQSSMSLLAAMFAAAAMVACGGGGSGGEESSAPAPAPAPAPTSGPQASLVTPALGKTPWNLSTAAQFSLKDASGAAVGTALSCSSDAAEALTVTADCSSVKGLRLGVQTVTVSGGGVSAKASIKVIPPAQALGAHANTDYSLVVTPDGRVLVWGSNSRDGALGQGKTRSELAGLSLPTAVKDSAGTGVLSGIVAASAGSYTAMALTEDGEIYSWGNEGYRTIGRPVSNGDPLPGKVIDPTGNATLQRIVSVSVGEDNAVALADDGTVYSWGNWSGQPGPDPKRTPGVVPVAGKAVAVSAGWQWSSALLADGRVMTWGFSASGTGNLGQPSVTTSSADAPGFVIDKSTNAPLGGIVSLSAGYLHGMALNAAGQVYAWGANSSGELGQGTTSAGSAAAVLVKAPGGASTWSGIKSVVAGGGHSLALDTSGKVYSWGYSQNGELGDGANHPRVNSSALPAAVVNAAGVGQLSGIHAVYVGKGHSMALATDGSVLSWGQGLLGNLGQGGSITSAPNSFVPLLVKNEAGTSPLTLAPLSD